MAHEIFLGDVPITLGVYPDGTPVIDWDQITFSDSRVMTIRSTELFHLVTGLWLSDALDERGWGVEVLVIPCLPGARQDRLSTEGDFLFTAKAVAGEINSRKFDKVICFDPHSEVMPALIDRCQVVQIGEIWDLFPRTVPEAEFIIAPDAGAMKRAGHIAELMGLPLVHGWKKRDPKTNKLSGFGIEDLMDVLTVGQRNKGLIIDDICDGGGTFIGLGKLIKERYPIVELDLYVSHGFFLKGMEPLMQVFNHCYTTNSTTWSDEHVANANGSWLEVAPILPTLLTKAL